MEQASCRPTECYIRLSKHRVGRQSTLSNWSKHCVGRQSTLSDWSKHCVGRQSAISDGASIVSAVRVLYPMEQALCRPSECFFQKEIIHVACGHDK
ncbi:MAG: hypothetical protein J5543_07585 [Bacteroidales bacterium]|nr:hypothetical protein [Bacteroidales bacterium]